MTSWRRLTLYFLTWAAYGLALVVGMMVTRSHLSWGGLGEEALIALKMLPFLFAVGLTILVPLGDWSIGVFGLVCALMMVHAISLAVSSDRRTVTGLLACQIAASVASLVGTFLIAFRLH